MPMYLITVRPQHARPRRRTVATLDETQSRVWHMLADAHGALGRQVPSDQHHSYIAATRPGTAGGTIGPLPDGTVIEVRPA